MKRNLARVSRGLDGPDDTVGLIRNGEVIATETAHHGSETGEQALMRAVLQDAILCLQGHATGVPRRDLQRAAAQARRWIVACDLTWLFSFESICHVLGLDPDCLRGRLLRASLVATDAAACGRRVWDEGGMVSMLRAVRMRGNQQRRRLTLRRYRRRRAVQPSPQLRDSHTGSDPKGDGVVTRRGKALGTTHYGAAG